eukprot:5705153-Prymnesium_polylepis.1
MAAAASGRLAATAAVYTVDGAPSQCCHRASSLRSASSGPLPTSIGCSRHRRTQPHLAAKMRRKTG